MEDYYLWLKAFHIIFVIFWCAGLLMMPRFFAYHMQCDIGSTEDKSWQEREKRLLRIIMNPSLIAVWILGLALVHVTDASHETWFYIKFLFAFILTVLHMFFARWRRKMTVGDRPYSEKFFRVINEIPSLFIIIIVIMVTVKPFS